MRESMVAECRNFLSKSLFVVGEFGGNDYSTLIFAGKSLTEAYSLMPKVIRAIRQGVEVCNLVWRNWSSCSTEQFIVGSIDAIDEQRLIGHGAVHVVVPGMLPIGCLPMYLTLYNSSDANDYSSIGCLDKFNALTDRHNSLLEQAMQHVQRKYSWTRIRYADFFTPTIQFLTDPTQYGGWVLSLSLFLRHEFLLTILISVIFFFSLPI